MVRIPRVLITGLIVGVSLAVVPLVPRLVHPAPRSLTLLPTDWPGDQGFIAIQELGLDKSHGLDLNLPAIKTSDDIVQAFRNGTTDVLNFTLDVAINLAATDPDMAVIYAYNESSGADGMVARKEIRTLADLRGKRIGAETGATSHYLLLAILKKAGLTLDDITYIDVQADEVNQALETGQVDAVVTWEPNLSTAVALPNMHILTTSRDFPNLILNVLVVRKSKLQANRDSYIQLVEAWDQMRATCETEADRCWQLLSAINNRPSEALKAEADGIRFLRLEDNHRLFAPQGGPNTVAAQLQATYDFLKSTNPNLSDFDPQSLYEPSIVEAARP
ncbi:MULTISPECIES: ABC transporter substrate-binding protein [unclassified Leptolyngbya]|uniref:ABC transporter substrate-binding protein n=1 Tax=unclassified Leptolyngbya TaxID=2650499 RepID=UPI0016847BAB|nr:ABC transporter substrate-binding protein [Leptolyngbya sp. FACHB-8]MBD2153700.1 ABC transporter substrate-binding protein [Leptolyngbya sp. FACHB-16]